MSKSISKLNMETYCVLVKMTTIYVNGKMCHHCSRNHDVEGDSMFMYFFIVTCMVSEDNENHGINHAMELWTSYYG